MTDLDTFRSETRAWLEANCPPEMRDADAVGGRCLLGRAQLDLQVGRATPVARAHGRARLDRARLAEGIRRRRPVAAPKPRCWRRRWRAIGARIAADQLRHLDARPGAARVRHRGAEAALSAARSRAARSAGARAIPSRAPAPTSPGCRPRRRTRATTGWSTARRSGPATPTRPTGSSAWCAPTTEAKQDGISFLLFDMATPGVATRPILLISGNSPFCETFFDDVKVPKDADRRRSEQAAGTSPSICSATSAR